MKSQSAEIDAVFKIGVMPANGSDETLRKRASGDGRQYRY